MNTLMLSPFNLCLKFANEVEFLVSKRTSFHSRVQDGKNCLRYNCVLVNEGLSFCDPRKLYVDVFSNVDGSRDVKYLGVRSLFIS